MPALPSVRWDAALGARSLYVVSVIVVAAIESSDGDDQPSELGVAWRLL
jgi:hypothetical protein